MHTIKRIHIYLLMAAALFIHLTVLDYLKIFGTKPDIILLVIIFFGFFFDEEKGFEAGLVGGILKDIFAFDVFGINTIIYCAVGFLVGVMRTKFFKESKVTQLLAVFFATVFSMMLHFFAVSLLAKSFYITLSGYFSKSVLPSSIYTALVSIPVYALFEKRYRLREREEFL